MATWRRTAYTCIRSNMDNWKKHLIDWEIGNDEEKIYEEQYKCANFLQITFPEFWQKSYEKKNNFYQHVYLEAKKHVEILKRGEEYLNGDLCKEWWHRHCDFCWKTIDTNLNGECYCSEDIELWVCAECFNAFKGHFEWVAEIAEDIPAKSIGNIVGIIIGQTK